MAKGTALSDPITILGVESSCDDSAAALVRMNGRGGGDILSSIVLGQADRHAPFGGVVPEIAARAHAEVLDHCVEQALAEAGLDLTGIDAVAATSGPGLIGGLLAGVMTARGIAAGAGLPLIGVNHLEGHALTPRLLEGTPYPYLMLLVSGGHCQFIAVTGLGQYRRLGGTIDDAPGEAFDKIAKHMGLGYPGGPEVERTAKQGDADRFKLPRPLLDREGLEMSFSGLKTALRRACDQVAAEKGGITEQDRADLCAAFQQAMVDVMAEKSRRALSWFRENLPAANPVFAVAGGVAANGAIRAALSETAALQGFRLLAPPLALCTDNAAMIAWAGGERLMAGQVDPDAIRARPRWPLDDDAAPMLGSGRKGPKA